MGALTFTFMGTEELKITRVEYLTGNHVNVTLQNTGTSPITVTEIHLTGGSVASGDLLTTDRTLSANSQTEIQVTYTWTNGNNYELKVLTSKGNQFIYSAPAPSS
jgi:hypothetical protein